jgi:hypothetical protein
VSKLGLDSRVAAGAWGNMVAMLGQKYHKTFCLGYFRQLEVGIVDAAGNRHSHGSKKKF